MAETLYGGKYVVGLKIFVNDKPLKIIRIIRVDPIVKDVGTIEPNRICSYAIEDFPSTTVNPIKHRYGDGINGLLAKVFAFLAEDAQ